MPQFISRLETGLPFFPSAGEGAIYLPISKEVDHKMRAHAVQTINSEPDTLYDLWCRLDFIPRWQEFVISVTPQSDTVSTWIMGDPSDPDPDAKRITFDSEIVEDIPGELLSWRSITEGVEESGIVTFTPAPGNRGTIVLLQQVAKIPGGKLGYAAAALTKRTPLQVVIENLRHFKQLAEAGEIPSVARNPHGPRGIIGSWKERLYGENNPTPPGTSNL